MVDNILWLDRLFCLLDTGSSPVTRRAAAVQLGEVQKLHPHELHNLLAKVRKYLHSSCWDTRIAASQAVEAIISHVPQWDPPGVSKEEQVDGGCVAPGASAKSPYHWMRFEHFDIDQVLKHGGRLLASDGSEFDLDDDLLGGSQSKERLLRQRRLLHRRLGMEMAEHMGLDTSNLFCAEDLAYSSSTAGGGGAWVPPDNVTPPVKQECAALMEASNQLFLEDLSLRLLCVLALDKFGDFVSDQVVAPVRETCAQTLGHILHLMGSDSKGPNGGGVWGVLRVLLQLLQRPEWEARHGGLLGIKYLLAVRKDLTSVLIPAVFEPVFQGLQDQNDDVSAVAAAALVPVTEELVRTLPHQVPRVVRTLWDALLELDDLTSSTSSILMLLAALLSHFTRLGNATAER
ncbi:hypothetical protein V5799_022862 [Amblyomma americanum]|uniref:Tata-binding protein-associated factor 172 n=1 Tax=Amblyomma americanum TaxID=6943 RepID=A0AAQ4FLJ7_AMBAM